MPSTEALAILEANQVVLCQNFDIAQTAKNIGATAIALCKAALELQPGAQAAQPSEDTAAMVEDYDQAATVCVEATNRLNLLLFQKMKYERKQDRTAKE